MYNCFITGFKFIIFYHILFHVERGEKVHSKWIMYNCFISSFKCIYYVLSYFVSFNVKTTL